MTNSLQNQKRLQYYIPEINAVLYGALVILIPFIMLQNYLQATIYQLNQIKFDIFGIETPIIVLAFLIIIITLFILYYKQINLYRIVSFFIIVLLLILAEGLTDYYITSNYFDLQNNWHYFAYGTYSVILFRLFNLRHKPLNKVLIYTFLICFGLSTFDEGYQYFLSSRVFDVSDIAKDTWGCNLGLLAVLFVFRQGSDFKNNYKLHHKKLREYFKEPANVLLIQVFLSLFFVFFSSLMTDHKYILFAFIIPLIIFIICFFAFHFFQYKKFKKILFTFIGLLVIIQAIFIIIYFNDNFSYCDNNIVIYKGIVFPYCDIMVSSRGKINPIDKKEEFNNQDIRFLINQQHDIVLIAKGNDNSGGKGFYKHNDEDIHFLYNPYTNKGIQFIILDSKQACIEFNRLKKQGKDVLMIIHNS